MTRRLSADRAGSEFGQILDRAADHNERFVVERNGEPAVMILSLAEFARAVAPTPDWLTEIQSASRRTGTDAVTMEDIDAEIAAARRDRKSG
jgi:prevent-host-death family protein